MGYVMVPVLEEHVEEAMQMILRIVARARLEEWDDAGVVELFGEVDEPSRAVISAVARVARNNAAVADTEVADSVEMTQREVVGIAREVNERANSLGRRTFLSMQQDVEVLPNGRERERRMLGMERENAERVLAAEKAELASTPHPLLGSE